MPAPTTEPAGTLVEVLCGQPEQKYGVRADERQQRWRALSGPGRLPGGYRRESGPGGEPAGQPGGDRIGVEHAIGGEQRGALGCRFAGDTRRGRGAVEDLPDGRLNEAALLLHDDDLVQTVGEPGDLRRNERMNHGQPQQPHARRLQSRLVEPEDTQGLAQVEVRLAGGDQAELGERAEALDLVQPVGLSVGARGVQPDALAGSFHLRQVRLQQARVDLVLESRLGQDGRYAIVVELDLAGPVGDIRDDLQCDPQAAAARHRDGMRPQVEHVLRIGRVEDGHPEVGEQDLGGAGKGR